MSDMKHFSFIVFLASACLLCGAAWCAGSAPPAADTEKPAADAAAVPDKPEVKLEGKLETAPPAQGEQPEPGAAEEPKSDEATPKAARPDEPKATETKIETQPEAGTSTAAGPDKDKRAVDEIFIIADRGWRDPFTDPRDKGPERTVEDRPPEDVGEEVQKIWENARDSLLLEGIMGWENELSAVIGGVRVIPGDKIQAEKLEFKVERITKDEVELRCITEQEKYKQLKDLKVKKTIRF